MNTFKVFRTSKTKVDNKLPSFKAEAKQESEVKPEEAEQQEHDVAGMFEELFGEQGEKVDEANVSVKKPAHVRRDDESDDEEPPQEKEQKPKYKGRMVNEGIKPSKTKEGDAELDDLIADVMGMPEPEPATSTPSKDDAKGADFGLSVIKGDDEPAPDKKAAKV